MTESETKIIINMPIETWIDIKIKNGCALRVSWGDLIKVVQDNELTDKIKENK